MGKKQKFMPKAGKMLGESFRTDNGMNTSLRKDNLEEVTKRKAALESLLEEKRKIARHLQEEKMARAAAQKEERLCKLREHQQREMLRAKAALDRRTAALAEAEEKKNAILAKTHAVASRLSSQHKPKPLYAFGSSTPRELGYLTQLSKEQKVYDRKLLPTRLFDSPVRSPIGSRGPSVGNSIMRSMYATRSEIKPPRRDDVSMTQSVMVSTKTSYYPKFYSTPGKNNAEDEKRTLSRTPKSSSSDKNKFSKQFDSPKNEKSKPIARSKNDEISPNESKVIKPSTTKKRELPPVAKKSHQGKKSDHLDEPRKQSQEEIIVDLMEKNEDNQSFVPHSERIKADKQIIAIEIDESMEVVKEISVEDDDRVSTIVELDNADSAASEMREADELNVEQIVEAFDIQKQIDAPCEVVKSVARKFETITVDHNLNETAAIEDDLKSLAVELAEANNVLDPAISSPEKKSIETTNEIVDMSLDESEFGISTVEEKKIEPIIKTFISSPEKKLIGISTEIVDMSLDESASKISFVEEKKVEPIIKKFVAERLEQEQREREERKAKLASIMSRTRGTPTAIVNPTTKYTDPANQSTQDLSKDFRDVSVGEINEVKSTFSQSTASVLQKIASSNPRLLSVLRRNGSSHTLADELAAADPTMTLPGQVDENDTTEKVTSLRHFDSDVASFPVISK